MVSAPTIDVRLRRVTRRLAGTPASIASVHRDVGRYAEGIGLVRPSYEQIRIHVHQARLRRAQLHATAELLIGVDLGVRPLSDLSRLFAE